MNRLLSGCPWVLHVIFILMLSIYIDEAWADDSDLKVIEKAQGIFDLHLCKDDRLGVELFCNRDWKQEVGRDAVLFTISEDPAVLLTVARSKELVTGMDELTEDKIKHLGQYANGFKIEHLKVGDDSAIKVEGFSSTLPELRLMDYYVIHDYQLYSLLFSVNPKEEWVNYSVLFSKIVEGAKITGGKI